MLPASAPTGEDAGAGRGPAGQVYSLGPSEEAWPLPDGCAAAECARGLLCWGSRPSGSLLPGDPRCSLTLTGGGTVGRGTAVGAGARVRPPLRCEIAGDNPRDGSADRKPAAAGPCSRDAHGARPQVAAGCGGLDGWPCVPLPPSRPSEQCLPSRCVLWGSAGQWTGLLLCLATPRWATGGPDGPPRREGTEAWPAPAPSLPGSGRHLPACGGEGPAGVPHGPGPPHPPGPSAGAHLARVEGACRGGIWFLRHWIETHNEPSNQRAMGPSNCGLSAA